MATKIEALLDRLDEQIKNLRKTSRNICVCGKRLVLDQEDTGVLLEIMKQAVAEAPEETPEENLAGLLKFLEELDNTPKCFECRRPL